MLDLCVFGTVWPWFGGWLGVVWACLLVFVLFVFVVFILLFGMMSAYIIDFGCVWNHIYNFRGAFVLMLIYILDKKQICIMFV